MTWLRIEDRGPVRWLTMDRPDRLNAVPEEGWADLKAAFEDFEASEARVLVVGGSGGAFCAGADLDPGSGLSDVRALAARMKLVGSAALALHRSTKPTVAAVDGVAVGAGLNLALGCDVVIATERARFSEIFVRRGLTLDFGGSWLLPRIVGLQRAKELALSGRILGAEEALRLGLCLEVVAQDDLEASVDRVVGGFLEGAPVAQMFAKQAIDHAWDVSFEQALDWEGQSQAVCFATEDVIEGVAAFLQKRSPEWKGR